MMCKITWSFVFHLSYREITETYVVSDSREKSHCDFYENLTNMIYWPELEEYTTFAEKF
jgi:hypothetical protein